MDDEIITTDFSKFGYRERHMAKELLEASEKQGFPDDFNQDEITIMMNMNSGNVFFTNSDYQVAMMNGDDLESFYTCPNCGHEGFKEEMQHGEDNKDCQEYLKEIGFSELLFGEKDNVTGQTVKGTNHTSSINLK